MKKFPLKTISAFPVRSMMLAALVCLFIGAGFSTAPAQPRAYVANQGDNNVSVVNTATNTVVAIVPVGNAPTGVAITSNGASVYVTNNRDNTVSVIDTATNTVIATVPVGSSPSFGVAITPNGARAYAANSGDNT